MRPINVDADDRNADWIKHVPGRRQEAGLQADQRVLGSNWEDLRNRYRPTGTSLLFIGESPPAGLTFFYCGNTRLFKHTHEAFRVAFPRDCPQQPTEFLCWFQGLGCYLEDLSIEPINNLSDPYRERARIEAIGDLSRRLAEHAGPCRRIIIVMKAIVPHVFQAIQSSDPRLSDTTVDSLPFPAQGHQRLYKEALARCLREHFARP